MSVISSRKALIGAMKLGIAPTIPALENFLGEVNDFLSRVNDYDEWNANKETLIDHGDHGLERVHEPAITVAKLRKMVGYEA